MAAPNKQPAGSRPGPARPQEHDCIKGGKSSTGNGGGSMGKGLPAHGAPKPTGNGKSNPLK